MGDHPLLAGSHACRQCTQETLGQNSAFARGGVPVDVVGRNPGADVVFCERGKRQDVGYIRIDDLELNLGERRATRGGRVLALNKTQYELLRLLATASPAVVSRSSLEDQIWGDDPPDSDALRTHVYRLRNIVDKQKGW